MRKLWMAILLFPSIGWAVMPGPGEVSRVVDKQSGYNSDAVYQSSLTCAGSTLQSVWVSSPNPASLFSIKVSSPGSGGAFFEVWDGQPSTGQLTTATFPSRKVDYVNSMIAGQHFYSISFSSWLGVSNQPGLGNPACLDIIYKVR